MSHRIGFILAAILVMVHQLLSRYYYYHVLLRLQNNSDVTAS